MVWASFDSMSLLNSATSANATAARRLWMLRPGFTGVAKKPNLPQKRIDALGPMIIHQAGRRGAEPATLVAVAPDAAPDQAEHDAARHDDDRHAEEGQTEPREIFHARRRYAAWMSGR